MSGFDILGPGDPRSLQPLRGTIGETSVPVGEGEGEREGFSAYLSDALGEVRELQADVKGKAEAIARGEPVELHELMIAMGKSEVAFNLMLEVRNKLVEAWQILSRTSV